jgi:hypothetical protein
LLDHASFPVLGLLSLQALPGNAVPFTTPAQSTQVLFGTMPVVPPEHTPQASTLDVPFATPAQSKVTGVPAHWQLPLKRSLIVLALLSLHAVPGSAGPLTAPKQSRQVLFGTMPVVPPEHTPQASTLAVPFATPAQSKFTAVPAHWHVLPRISLTVFALPSLQDDPI